MKPSEAHPEHLCRPPQATILGTTGLVSGARRECGRMHRGSYHAPYNKEELVGIDCPQRN